MKMQIMIKTIGLKGSFYRLGVWLSLAGKAKGSMHTTEDKQSSKGHITSLKHMIHAK